MIIDVALAERSYPVVIEHGLLSRAGEQLAPLQWLAIGCVMLASFGSALTSARA